MLANLFYRNGRLTALTIGLVLVAGLSALRSLPRQEDPTLARRFGTITTFLPGASALRVETLVTEKIEAELLELHEIDELDSLSRTGLSVIQVDLRDEVPDSGVDQVWSKVVVGDEVLTTATPSSRSSRRAPPRRTWRTAPRPPPRW